MDMEYKPNSHNYKARVAEEAKNSEAKKPKQIAKAKIKKKGALEKTLGNFVSEDAGNVKSYILSDVLIPAVKKLVVDIVRDGVEMFVYGEKRTGDRFSSGGNRPNYVSYNKYSDRSRLPEPRYASLQGYNDVVLETRAEAEEVLDALNDILSEYPSVSVADLYDLVGIEIRHTDNKYGWTRLTGADIRRTRDGYLLKMPRPIPID